MDNETQDAPEVLETQEIEQETPVVPETDEEKENLRKEVEDLKKKNSQLYARVKKEETKAPLQTDGLSSKDVLFLAKVDVHADDIDDVLDWAKFKKVSVTEAYKQLKGVLDVKAEERKTAAVTQTKGSPRGTTKITSEDLLQKAELSGEVPDTAEGLRQLVQARLARRKSH
jgi:hypothetical protein